LPAVKIVGPANGFRFTGADTQIWLAWEAVAPLQEDEWYAVSLRYFADGTTRYAGSWEKETRWLVSRQLYQKPDPKQPGYAWDVTVVRQTGTKPDGGRLGAPLSQVSETRTFLWE
jgi:hypothetical protein